MDPLKLTVLLVSSAALARADQTQCVNGPCGPGNDQCGAPFDQTSPQYHIRDLSCGENDPNFPLYDARHSLFHAFYQDHLAEPQGGNGQGPVIGHAVSADQVFWAHLPVAVWNDQPYDNVAIYTGSATIVNGVPTMVYPGLCKKNDWAQCDTGTLFAIALPADASDALLTNWSKPSYNPIVENVQRDPSTAWQTAAGEWRFTNYEGKVFISDDFVSWSTADNGTALWDTAECPDFFALPSLCTGNGCSATKGPQPTHVHKQSSGGQDWYTLGIYTDGPAKSTGNWTPIVSALQPLDFSAVLGGHDFYASKSYLDPTAGGAQGRRIYYGWAIVPPASTQTLARVTNYHAGLQILTFNPLPELSALRAMPPLFTAASMTVQPGQTMWLGDWARSAGNQSEFGATFAFPASASTFGVSFMVSNPGTGAPNISTTVSIYFDPVSFTANVSTFTGGSSINLTYYMPGLDLPGDDYNITNVNYTDPHICQTACSADPNCAAYTYVTRPPLVASCCLKSDYGDINPNAPTCTSGVKPGHVHPGAGGVPMPLWPGDSEVDVRVFVDNTFAEIFIMQGRVAITVPVSAGAAALSAGMNVFVGAGGAAVTATDVNVWHMNSIWVSSPAEVLEARDRIAAARMAA